MQGFTRHAPARRRAATALGLGALLLAACSAPPPEPVPHAELDSALDGLERPNFVLVICDTLRADWLSPYGYERDTSPELARWAERGVVFERTLSQSSWTKVSMASMLTSLWPRSHGIEDSTDGLSDKATTLAEELRAGGYRTFGVQTNGWLEQSFGFQQGFERYVFPHGRGAVGLEQPSLWSHGRRVLFEFGRILKRQSEGEPFLIYLHLMDVHEYAAPPEFKKFGETSEGAYLASILWIDDVVRKVREKIEATPFADETILVFGADHGETFGENNRYGHARNVLSAVLHVPLLFRFPFPTEPVRVASQVRNVDLGPTLLELAGLEVPRSFEGESLVPLMLSPERGGDRPNFASLREPLFRDAVLQDTVTDGDWTYARNLDSEGEPNGELLFDRQIDPWEDVNLIGREPEQAERMRELLEEHLAAEPEEEVVDERVRINPGIANRLRALGYLQDEPIDAPGAGPLTAMGEPEPPEGERAEPEGEGETAPSPPGS